MNILDIQDKLKNFSQEQLVQEMQMPTGQLPQFLLLSEITRRKKMQDSYAQQQDQAQEQTTVAQDAINAAGMPQEAAQQLAGTMAPQTDMAGNTGAMPQQQMMPQAPQPVQGMAGGGIVALEDGGRITAPRLVVRNGRQFAEMPDGSLIPMSALGFDEAELSGAGGADLAAPESGVRQGPIPSQEDLDADYRMSQTPGIRSIPARLPAYGADSFMDANLPGVQSPVLVGGGDAIASAQIMRPFGLAEPDYAGARSYPPHVQGAARPPRASLAPDAFQENFDYGAVGSEGVPPPAAEPRVPRELVEFVENFDYDGGGAPNPGVLERIFGAPALERIGAPTVGTPQTPAPEVLTPDENTLRPQARPDAEALAAAVAPPGPLGGGGGGIAAQGAAAPSDFEQELMTMLAAREKRAEQDKFLALAQAGMALMSSTQPTFGGALGEAGASGLAALREGQAGSEADRLALLGQIEQSRMGRERLDLERQALAARQAASGRPTAIPAAALSELGDQITAISERLSDTMNPVTADQRTTLTNELESLQQKRTALNAMYFGQYGVAFSGAPAASGTPPVLAPSARSN